MNGRLNPELRIPSVERRVKMRGDLPESLGVDKPPTLRISMGLERTGSKSMNEASSEQPSRFV